MTDSFLGRADSITAPVRRGFIITTSDGADLSAPADFVNSQFRWSSPSFSDEANFSGCHLRQQVG